MGWQFSPHVFGTCVDNEISLDVVMDTDMYIYTEEPKVQDEIIS